MLDLSYIIPDMTTQTNERTEERKNRFNGESEMLSEEEFALYHLIKHAEETEQYDAVRKGLRKFSEMNAKAYMTLLD